MGLFLHASTYCKKWQSACVSFYRVETELESVDNLLMNISTILVTGAGGAAAISVWKSLRSLASLHMGDIDDCASGLYLVPTERRLLLPRGDSPDFVPVLLEECKRRKIELLIPTVDAELVPLAKAKASFAKAGIEVAVAEPDVLALIRDKAALLSRAEGVVPIPWSVVWTESSSTQLPSWPAFAKPRAGSGSRDLMTIRSLSDLAQVPRSGEFVVQELLPGEEFSVDVYVSRSGLALASVPRIRMKTDSGIAVTARTVMAPDVSQAAVDLVKALGLPLVANVQFKRSHDGVAKLLEINPRFPGTLPLTAAAGIDIPRLMWDDFSGRALPTALLPYSEVMTVRYWTEHPVDIAQWRQLANRSKAATRS
jgi:carbamoyl-phosphate synthase large subunit